jgi:hypothetical protein
VLIKQRFKLLSVGIYQYYTNTIEEKRCSIQDCYYAVGDLLFRDLNFREVFFTVIVVRLLYQHNAQVLQFMHSSYISVLEH